MQPLRPCSGAATEIEDAGGRRHILAKQSEGFFVQSAGRHLEHARISALAKVGREHWPLRLTTCERNSSEEVRNDEPAKSQDFDDGDILFRSVPSRSSAATGPAAIRY
jgi:hypothetical protein